MREDIKNQIKLEILQKHCSKYGLNFEEVKSNEEKQAEIWDEYTSDNNKIDVQKLNELDNDGKLYENILTEIFYPTLMKDKTIQMVSAEEIVTNGISLVLDSELLATNRLNSSNLQLWQRFYNYGNVTEKRMKKQAKFLMVCCYI